MRRIAIWGASVLLGACGGTPSSAPGDADPAERGTVETEREDADEDVRGTDDDAGDDEDEVPVRLADLPAEVVRAIAQAYPDSTLVSAEMDGRIYDVLVLTARGLCMEVEVQADGVIVGSEEEDARECG